MPDQDGEASSSSVLVLEAVAPPYHLARHRSPGAAPRKGRVPAGEGLRGRPDPPRRGAADPDGDRLPAARLAYATWTAGDRWWHAGWSWTGRRWPPTRTIGLTRHPVRLRRQSWPSGPLASGHNTAHRAQRDRPGARRRRPRGAGVEPPPSEERATHVPGPPRGGGRPGVGPVELPLGLGADQARGPDPWGSAVRRYYRCPAKHDDDYLESWLELRSSNRPTTGCLPGYGWIFGMGDEPGQRRPGHPQLLQGIWSHQLPGTAR